jgi:hypothetical protein
MKNAILACIIVFAVIVSASASLAGEEAVARGTHQRVVLGPDGKVHVFYNGSLDGKGRPTALVRATLENGSWTEEEILKRPALIPSANWEILDLGNGHFLIGTSFPRRMTLIGLTPSEAKYANTVVPTFIEIRPLNLSDADRKRLKVAKKYSSGSIKANPYIKIDNASELSDLLIDNNGNITVIADGLYGKGKAGRFVSLRAPEKAPQIKKNAKAALVGDQTVILYPSGEGENRTLKRVTTKDGKTFTEPESVIDDFNAEEFAVAKGPDGRCSLVTVEREEDGSCRIVLRVSTDGGKTWSEPVEIAHADGPASGVHAAVDSDGTLHVVWNETREDGKFVIHKSYKSTSAD